MEHGPFELKMCFLLSMRMFYVSMLVYQGVAPFLGGLRYIDHSLMCEKWMSEPNISSGWGESIFMQVVFTLPEKYKVGPYDRYKWSDITSINGLING